MHIISLSLLLLSVSQECVQGLLSDDFNTSWCNDFFDKGSCPRGQHCKYAHTLKQLHIEAGIEKGTIQPAFKTNFCANMASHGKCTVCLMLAFLLSLFSCQQKCVQAVRLMSYRLPTYATRHLYSLCRICFVHQSSAYQNQPCLIQGDCLQGIVDGAKCQHACSILSVEKNV